jgi:hypothetical protein
MTKSKQPRPRKVPIAGRRIAPDYTGVLRQPIVWNRNCRTGLLGTPAESLDRVVDDLKQRVAALHRHYGTNATPDGWRDLALALAHNHIDGFQILDRPKRGRGALPRTASDQFVDLRLCLDVMRYKAKGCSIKGACERLVNENPLYKGIKWKALLDRFNSADKRVVKTATYCIKGALRGPPVARSVVTAWLRGYPPKLLRAGLLDLLQVLLYPPPNAAELAPDLTAEELSRYERNLSK